jgi:hypothetical protein
MLVSLELDVHSIPCMHAIGISSYMSSETIQVEYHIIDGTHPDMRLIHFNQENIDWCCGNRLSFTKITHGFVVLETPKEKSPYNSVPGTAVRLTTGTKKRKRGKNNSV